MSRSRTPSEQRKVEDMRWKTHHYVPPSQNLRGDAKPDEVHKALQAAGWVGRKLAL